MLNEKWLLKKIYLCIYIYRADQRNEQFLNNYHKRFQLFSIFIVENIKYIICHSIRFKTLKSQVWKIMSVRCCLFLCMHSWNSVLRFCIRLYYLFYTDSRVIFACGSYLKSKVVQYCQYSPKNLNAARFQECIQRNGHHLTDIIFQTCLMLVF